MDGALERLGDREREEWREGERELVVSDGGSRRKLGLGEEEAGGDGYRCYDCPS